MKKYILISISALLFCSCVKSKIFLYEVEGSEEFPNSSLTINEIKSEGSDFLFDFNINIIHPAPNHFFIRHMII